MPRPFDDDDDDDDDYEPNLCGDCDAEIESGYEFCDACWRANGWS